MDPWRNLALSASIFICPLAEAAQVFDLDEKSEREIATWARIEIPKPATRSILEKCIPRESQPFTGEWGPELDSKIFEPSALGDLMKCDRKSCAFNFLPSELAQLESTKNPEERKALYRSFYKSRFLKQTELIPERTRFFLRSKDRPFSICQSSEFDELLDLRQNSSTPIRLSHVRYSDRMRPTTRLVQGLFFNAEEGSICYGEAFIFSDHYDLDRLEMWKFSPQKDKSTLELQIRHRIDLLNTWFRRLNKGALRDELRQLAETQIGDAALCIASQNP